MADTPRLREGTDYYWEAGRMVLTAAYHLRRGSCCGNRCRHCPYEHVNVRALGAKKKGN